MTVFKELPTALVMAGALTLAGCGGGGGDSGGGTPAVATVSAAEGLWVGTTGDGRAVTGLVFENGLYYILYSQVGDARIAGVVQGNSSTSGANFTSGNARDFNLEGSGVLAATVAGSVAAKSAFAGTVTYGPGLTNTFSATYDSDYELTPSLSAVAGFYTGDAAYSGGVEETSITIGSDGAISGAGLSGCAVSGSVTPRARGNAYKVSITFGGAPCHFANQTLTGLGYYEAMSRTFYSATPNAARTDGVLFVAGKSGVR